VVVLQVRGVLGVGGLPVVRVDHEVVHDGGDEPEDEHGGDLRPGLVHPGVDAFCE
jgi:hypothetical protein